MASTHKLLTWYKHHLRDLPWRRTSDPYMIWVSEIMLQQTRVEQGLDYYLRFTRRFPDIRSLAEAEPDEVMKAWQGLGYYSRARNMQWTARHIVEENEGTFPRKYHEILALKGIGPYTAAAIASICYGEPTPVVDGNVLRFLSRLHGIKEPVDSANGRNTIRDLASTMMDRHAPGEFNQALMEFGALYCKPKKPDCRHCIFRMDCLAYKTGRVEELPARTKKTVVVPRYFTYLVVRFRKRDKDYFFLQKREEKDIWKGLYEFPLIETARPVSPKTLMQSQAWAAIFKGTVEEFVSCGKMTKHFLSHRVINARFYEVKVKKALRGKFIMVPDADIKNYPLPRLIERFVSSF
jgi:A/G-specific adenine glycosylase